MELTVEELEVKRFMQTMVDAHTHFQTVLPQGLSCRCIEDLLLQHGGGFVLERLAARLSDAFQTVQASEGQKRTDSHTGAPVEPPKINRRKKLRCTEKVFAVVVAAGGRRSLGMGGADSSDAAEEIIQIVAPIAPKLKFCI